MKKQREWQQKTYEIIFESDTPPGKAFDVALLISILLSVIVVMLESIHSVRGHFEQWLIVAEWIFTILFTIEYIMRIISTSHKKKYLKSFYGIIDLLAIIPTYLSLVIAGTQYLLIIRTLRLLRVFRILKLVRYTGASSYLVISLKASRYKIGVFLGAVLVLVTIMGSLMYIIEGPDTGFTSIPTSIYWAIVTLTTVGYGDIAPQTAVGQFLSSIIMIIGYAIIAVPTGIISAEMVKTKRGNVKRHYCSNCDAENDDIDAVYCKYCGNRL